MIDVYSRPQIDCGTCLSIAVVGDSIIGNLAAIRTE